jgi:plasmid stability protein
MLEQTTILAFVVPTRVKDLLRIRAARQKTSISEVARDIFLAHVPDPTDEERLFLASGDQTIEHIVQEPAQ